MPESKSPVAPSPAPSLGPLRLLSALTVFLALGNLVWFLGTFPSYFRWFSQGWLSPGMPLLLLWAFLGLPSLVCATVTLRLARSLDRPARASRLSFLLILGICTLVPLLASLASWTAGQGTFPWITWLVTLLAALLVWFGTLRQRVSPKPPSPPVNPA